jgi:cytoskeleton protein RodZ
MATAEQQNNTQTRPSGIGPGERLQAARIQKGLSLEDVAGRMHLSPRILEAIEENNFEEITAPIFVKGYLRAYARIVALDEDDMIQQYVDYYSEEDPPISSTSNTIPELSVADVRIKWTTYLVVLVLAALLSAWWWNKSQNEESPISLDTQAPGLESTEAAESDVVNTEIEAASEISTATDESTPAVQESAAAEAPAQSEAVAAESVETEAVASEAVESEPLEPEPLAPGPRGVATGAGQPRPAESECAHRFGQAEHCRQRRYLGRHQGQFRLPAGLRPVARGPGGGVNRRGAVLGFPR